MRPTVLQKKENVHTLIAKGHSVFAIFMLYNQQLLTYLHKYCNKVKPMCHLGKITST